VPNRQQCSAKIDQALVGGGNCVLNCFGSRRSATLALMVPAATSGSQDISPHPGRRRDLHPGKRHHSPIRLDEGLIQRYYTFVVSTPLPVSFPPSHRPLASTANSRNSFPCHTYKIPLCNSFTCNTSKNTRLKVHCLPHILKIKVRVPFRHGFLPAPSLFPDFVTSILQPLPFLLPLPHRSTLPKCFSKGGFNHGYCHHSV
jgi:hypothetical protein